MDFQNSAISAYLSDMASKARFNVFITITFAKKAKLSKPFCWNRNDISRAEKLVTAYTKDLNRFYFGSSVKVPKVHSGWLPLLAVPEYKDKIGRKVPLHYHCLALFPEVQREELSTFTQDWWFKRGLKRHDIGSPITADVKNIEIEGASRVASYSLKNTDKDFTVSRLVARGFLIDQPSFR